MGKVFVEVGRVLYEYIIGKVMFAEHVTSISITFLDDSCMLVGI